ncbi:RagB/SusD family nutrient uptake outer membrane protein [Chitinophaga cymbidii]|uniref:Membrane protein n=1 Tax=Chitinophaga cymbidii TaxID=1096750 RepID=A0A512RN93_9BACT|nr:RagB/SusD family nutrient uptake outer membrane protein [Chitinophaga cymbidii]GEP97139.1 membrane protein [Chitinophaga cymbidii]
MNFIKPSSILSYSWYLVLPAMLLTSCKKFLTIDPPVNQLVKANVFTDDQSAQAAVTGIYSSLNSLMGPLNFCASGNADDVEYSGSDESYIQFCSSSLQIDNSYIASAWRYLYKSIYDCNAALEGLTGSKLSESLRTRLTGEVRFLRAYCYYWLAGLWGDVPLVLTTDYDKNQSLPREKVALVYAQIINDLTEAKALLTNEYYGAERAYANKATASALLARTYLFLGDWEKAESEAGLVISDNQYQMADLAVTYKKGSTETIWQIEPSALYTAVGLQYVPWYVTSVPYWPLAATLLDAFEAGDERKTQWIAKTTVRDEDYYYPYKYMATIHERTEKNEYVIAFRLAEMYLTRAEARAQLNKVNGTNSAESDLNIIRGKANLLPLTGMGKEAALAAIAQERRLEFFSEWSFRWLDLKRTGKATAVLGSLKGSNWSEDDLLWPIPFAERQANPFLEQNKGYE